MKKILALTLAVMMMATIAFAGVVYKNPGASIKWNLSTDGKTLTDENKTSANRITADPLGTQTDWSSKNVEYNSKTVSITNVKWTKGSAYVASLTFNDDGQVVLKLKQDYSLTNEKEHAVLGEFKLNLKGKGVANSFELNNDSSSDYISVGYAINTYKLDGTGSIAPDAKEITEIEKSGTTSYDTINFGDAMGNDIEVRVYDKESLFLYSETDPDLDVVKKYSDTGAELDFISFPGAPTFSATAAYYIYAEKDAFIYTVKNGAISASGAKWSEDDGCWILKVRTLGSYVISDMKLAAVATTTTDTDVPNPGTGANDVVGIAAALAAVALMSAAAVSLKK